MASGYEPYIWAYFLEKIGNEYGVAGLMGNLKAESAMYPNNLQNSYNRSLGMTDEEYTSRVDSGSYTKSQFTNDSAGYGLAQWTYSVRKRRMYEFWKDGGYSSIGSISLACDYLWWELENSYKGVLNVLKNATSIREASDKVLFDFENPKNQGSSVRAARAANGQAYYDEFHGQTVDPTPPDEPDPGDDPDPDPDNPDPDIISGGKMDLMILILASRRRRGRVV